MSVEFILFGWRFEVLLCRASKNISYRGTFAFKYGPLRIQTWEAR